MQKKVKKQKNKINWKLFGRIWREIGRPYWPFLLVGMIFTIIAAASEGWAVTITKHVIDHGLTSTGNMLFLYIMGAQLIGAFVLKGLFNYVKALIMTRAGLKAVTKLQRRIFEHALRTNVSEIQKNGVGKYMNFFTVQAVAVQNTVTNMIVDLVQNLSSLLIMIGLMIYFAPQLVIMLVVLVPIIMVPVAIIRRKKAKLTKQTFSIANTSTQRLSQMLTGIKTIQSFGTEKYETEKFNTVLQDIIKNQYSHIVIGALRVPLIEIVIAIGLAMMLAVGGYFVTSGAITTGDFAAFMLAFFAANKPARTLSTTGEQIQQGLIAAETLFEFLDSKPLIRDAENAVELTGKKMSVEFKSVSFAYNAADGDILHDINLEVNAGQVCAFVGPSGGGKTTAFNLLERFYDPGQGEVLINGKNIKEYTLESLRKNISEVSQDVFLFNGTVLENIKYGTENATDEEIIRAAKIANAHDFIEQLPEKYDSLVGERGSMLSGGQKQRIAIARAILKNAPILLLDEATSALDTESEKQIQSALAELMTGRTVFVIAHRLSTILDADIICVMKSGRIIESGTDAQLVAQDGEYKKLRDIQFKTT